MTAKKFYIALIGLIALSFIAVAGSYSWGSGQLESEALAVSDLKADYDVTQEAILKLQKAQTDTEEVDSVVEILDRLLPEQKEQDKLIADIIYTATAEAGIPFSKVDTFSFQGGTEPNSLSGTTPSKEGAGVYEYPFSISISSISYDTLLKLLQEIETNGRIIQVSTVSISPETENSDVSVNLTMKAYLKP
jgi:Tfp pilus assembly protein PilO